MGRAYPAADRQERFRVHLLHRDAGAQRPSALPLSEEKAQDQQQKYSFHGLCI
jgi:hypothetical protein